MSAVRAPGRAGGRRPAPGRATWAARIPGFLLLVAIVPAIGPPALAQAGPPTALVSVNVIDVLDGRIDRGVTLLIEGQRITRVAAAASLPSGTRRVDLSGRYVIPGLWDMHVHSMLDERDADWFLPLLVANGVTGTRDMGSFVPLERMRRVREAIASGRRVGPRLVLAGSVMELTGAGVVDGAALRTSDGAADAVRRLAAQGADFITLSPLTDREAYRALLEAARRLRIPVAGPTPEPVTMLEATRAGQRSVEHLDRIVLGCSDAETDIVAIKEQVLRSVRVRPSVELLQPLAPTPEEILRTIDYLNAQRCIDLVRAMAASRMAVVPTLVVEEIYGPRVRRRDDPRLAYVPPTVREAWLAMSGDMTHAPISEALPVADLDQVARQMLRALIGAGVPILAGTHAAVITPFLVPGFSLHDELRELVRAGLTPLEALQAATLAPAQYLDDAINLGRVTEGRLADLVVLDANPLESIANTQTIRAVVANGRLFERAELDAMIDAAARYRR